MKGPQFRAELFRAFVKVGFVRSGKVVAHDGDAARVVVGVEVSDGTFAKVSVGFSLIALGGERPARVELSHMYFGLHRIFPAHRDLIIAAEMLDRREQPEAFAELLSLVQSEFAPHLVWLSSGSNLRTTYRDGALRNGLVWHFAERHLMSEAQ
jgi:hypothetical protein